MHPDPKATPKQMSFISAIEKRLDVDFEGETIEDADKFIKQYKEQFENAHES